MLFEEARDILPRSGTNPILNPSKRERLLEDMENNVFGGQLSNSLNYFLNLLDFSSHKRFQEHVGAHNWGLQDNKVASNDNINMQSLEL